MIKNRKACFCAFCKNSRKVYSSKHMSVMGIIGMVILSYVMTHVIWHQPDARGLVILGALLMVSEISIKLRWRQSLLCQHCGFDPVLYMKSPQLAAVKIQDFMKTRSEKPEFLLKPALNLATRRSSMQGAAIERHGENLSLRG
ncbi:hypothetical protein CIK05_10235 [Bdellovibrio sp. qaytius]|nr:hypothetical protein CIK05_10235 [Bdellovibrio sp. qaytius]